MMHHDKHLFQEAQDFLSWADNNHIKYLAKQIDGPVADAFSKQQITWFNSTYQNKTYGQYQPIDMNNSESLKISDVGRACCGGRQTCQDQNYKERQFYVIDNRFTDWYCSVDQFFLFVKQVNGLVYVNKDCKMRFDGSVGPIGSLSDTDSILNDLRERLTVSKPVIQCKRARCMCGLCAPKAQDLDTYKSIMQKYQKATQ